MTAPPEMVKKEEPKVPQTKAAVGKGVKAVFQTVVSRVLIQGLNVLTGIMTARMLMPAGRGELAAIILWSGLLAGLTSFGLPTAMIFHIRRSPERVADMTWNALFLCTVISCLTAAVGAVCMPSWLHQYPHWAIVAAQWFLLITPVASVTYILRAALEAKQNFSGSNLSQILNPAAVLVILGVLYELHRFDTLTAACAYIFAALPPIGLLLWRSRSLFDRGVKLRWATQKLLLSYGVRSYGIDLIGTLALQVDQVLVVSFLHPAELGVYVVMLSLSRVLNVFQGSVVAVLFPKATGLSMETTLAMTSRAVRMSTAITAVAAVTLGIVGPILLRIFYGRAYTSSIGTLRLLLVEVVLSGATVVLAQAFMALGRPGFVTSLQGVGLAVCVPMMLLLIPRWGIAGAAASLLISTTCRFITIYVSFRLVLKTKAPRLLLKKEDLLPLLTLLLRRTSEPTVAQ
ncbi:membrane protein involved in the export of O-antigen and teichoic acid [Terriglobus roseus DSM 18391]|uniref:Membrane protein involved in the export of O-antigen and teichoic acid n=1 Tax=Terriglobus roseus (strain DSM 18391 / NRRL B-41598 / KBS 63) TaxID=926566 RepID=I3ZFL6_TERRK|nr:oligosaccharide flippase family protein [Terriglobus roseus]AFL88034.1 membrane protein involved in the export of O-antigen and teichoic acid [Terriglobus roseus DSM 18391]